MIFPAGNQIAYLRLKPNWSQDTLAKQAGVSRPVVNRAEQNKPISNRSMTLIIKALSCFSDSSSQHFFSETR